MAATALNPFMSFQMELQNLLKIYDYQTETASFTLNLCWNISKTYLDNSLNTISLRADTFHSLSGTYLIINALT